MDMLFAAESPGVEGAWMHQKRIRGFFNLLKAKATCPESVAELYKLQDRVTIAMDQRPPFAANPQLVAIDTPILVPARPLLINSSEPLLAEPCRLISHQPGVLIATNRRPADSVVAAVQFSANGASLPPPPPCAVPVPVPSSLPVPVAAPPAAAATVFDDDEAYFATIGQTGPNEDVAAIGPPSHESFGPSIFNAAAFYSSTTGVGHLPAVGFETQGGLQDASSGVGLDFLAEDSERPAQEED